MEKAKVYLFTSPTCPHCPAAKRFIQKFKSSREDFELKEYSTMTPDGQKKAEHFQIMSVPTFVVNGPGYNGNIGLRGVQSDAAMNKCIDVALGKSSFDDEKEKKPFEFKIGKLKIKF